jgi:glutathione reductase (NADPH)
MATDSYDVLILGGGNAGFGVTVPTRKEGLKVALVEDRDLGGTCPNRGCTPKKVLVAAGHTLHEIRQAHVHGIEVSKPCLDWSKLIDREKTLIIVVATGSRPRPLPISGAELMITSDEVLSERQRPGSVLFVGGGVIALEFGHVYARAGTKVTILEVLPKLLPALDADAVEEIKAESEAIGIAVHTGVKVLRVERADGRLRTVFEANGNEHAIEADRVVNGAGRIANVDGLDLDKGNVKHDSFRIAVDDFLRSTSNPSVFVCGDALSSVQQLSPVATYEGHIVGDNIIDGPKHRPDYASLPSAVYTVPALASVGLTEAQAKEQGLNTKISVNHMEDWFSARTYAETRAYAKVIVDADSDLILGAHMVGHGAEELINIFALAKAHRITATAIRDFIFAYPSFASDIKHML